MLPNFLGIGVQRSATTWLYECLKEHPQIFLPDKKELHFFDNNFDKGLKWYESFFEGVSNEVAVGEITPDYLYNRKAVERMASVVPEAKLIVSLRHPVYRAYSAYCLLRSASQVSEPFEKAFWKIPYIKDVGFYYKHLTFLFEFYPRDQVMIILYDDIISSPERVIKSLYSFLGVDSDFSPSNLTKKYNKVLFPKFQMFLEGIGLRKPLSSFKRTKLANLIKDMFFYFENKKKVRLKKETISPLIDVYREDIVKLEKLIDRNLNSWLQP